MADIILEGSGETSYVVANNDTRVFGSGRSNDQITLLANVTGLTFGQNIEQLNMPGAITDYFYKSAGNQLEIYDRSGFVRYARFGLIDPGGTRVKFGSSTPVRALYAPNGRITLNGQLVSNNNPGPIS